MKNSLIVAAVTTVTTLVLSLLAAYAFCGSVSGQKF
jgi:ABC-type glycerol-3-phosphate transport system permease component